MTSEPKSNDDTQRTMHFEVPEAKSDSVASRCHASLVVLSGWEVSRDFTVAAGETVIGRSAEVEAPIDHPSISRRHCRVERISGDDGDRFRVADLGSTNGTFLNSVRVDQSDLHNGDRIQLGDVVLKFMIQDVADAQLFQEIHRRIHHDPSTGLLTIEAFRRQLESEIRTNARDGRFVLSMTDMDGLKGVNDSMGHLAGSYVIETMGQLIRDTVGVHNLAGLYGGDEAIILYRGANMATAKAMAETLRERVESFKWKFRDNSFRVTISQGLAEWPQNGLSMDDIISAADRALYKAKTDGRNCVRISGE